MLFEAGLAVVQLFHLAFLSEAVVADFVAWAVVHSLAQMGLALLRRSARQCVAFVRIAWRPLATLMLVALVFKLSSRLPYIQSWFADGLLATRQNEELGSGGWTSAFSIFFYPLAILLAFCTMPRNIYRRLMFGVLVVCAIDLVFLGTRNAPMFVLTFHALTFPLKLRARFLPLIGAALALFVALFSYSTANRAAESADGTFDWLVLFEFTASAEVLKIDRNTVAPVAQWAPGLLPAIFLSHYLTHSIAELNEFVGLTEKLPRGGLYYFRDQLCVIGLCNREDSLAKIESINPRPGVYQTMWASLILDFGWTGAFALFTLAIAITYAAQRQRRDELGMGVVLLTQMIMLSPIENYFYNGLGLAQTLCILVVYLSLRRRRGGLLSRSLKRRPHRPTPGMAADGAPLLRP
jgi:Ca2+/Na+ antiporter